MFTWFKNIKSVAYTNKYIPKVWDLSQAKYFSYLSFMNAYNLMFNNPILKLFP